MLKAIFILPLLLGIAHAERAYVLESQGSVKIHVIEFTEEENSGFELVDSKERNQYGWISKNYDPETHLFIINGGYFDHNFKPVGIFKVNGEFFSEMMNPKLSGYLTLTKQGALSLHWKEYPDLESVSILQAGPFLIDPGGEVGIYRKTGNPSRRTVIAQTRDQRILILTTTKVDLLDLANILKAELPQIERALNLDGGPSVGLIYEEAHIENLVPVHNFIRKHRSGVVDEKTQAVDPKEVSPGSGL